MKVEIKKSTRKGKKFMAIFFDTNGKRIKTTHFGLAGSKTFLDTNDEEKKQAYIKRHSVRENFNSYMTAGSLARWINWNKKTLGASIADYKRRFNLR